MTLAQNLALEARVVSVRAGKRVIIMLLIKDTRNNSVMGEYSMSISDNASIKYTKRNVSQAPFFVRSVVSTPTALTQFLADIANPHSASSSTVIAELEELSLLV